MRVLYVPKSLSKIGYKKVYNEILMPGFSTQMTSILQAFSMREVKKGMCTH